MIGLLGKKIGMTQVFDEQGQSIPVTVIEVGPCFVTAVRSTEKNGYKAVQLAFDDKREKRTNKADQGYFKKAGVSPKRFCREIRSEKIDNLKVGDELGADLFEAGDFVDVQGFTIGKGFQGVVKRHRFRGGPKSHGSMFGRVPGSIGASSFPSRVVKGMRAAGHMGAENLTIQNLKVVKVDADNNLIAVRGAVPGHEEGYVLVREALKRGKGKAWKVKEKKEAEAKSGEKQEAQAENASGGEQKS